MAPLKNIETTEWLYYGLWKQLPFSAFAWVEWYNPLIVKRLGVSLSSADTILANGHFIIKKSVIYQFEKNLSELIENKDTFSIKNFTSAGMTIFGECEKDIGKLKDLDQESFSKFIAIIKKAMAPWYVACLLSFCLENYLSREIYKGITNADAMAFLLQNETLVMKQYHEALEIKEIIKNKRLLENMRESPAKVISLLRADAATWAKIEQHVQKFAWIGVCNFDGEPLTIKTFLSSLPILSENNPLHTTKSPELSEDQLFIPKLAQDIGFMRQYGAEINSLIEYKALPFLEKVACEVGLSYKEMLSLTPTEVAALLRGEKINDLQSVIEKRQENYVLMIIENKEVVIDNSTEITEFLDRFVPTADLTLKEVKGTVASKGYARGSAKIILSPVDFKKMNAGDILITTMTTPDFVPLMHKSAAIVTDTGGLLSHAAIISREFKIPCIVGTQFATQIFHDGDLVEVDAEKGVVRKINAQRNK